MPKKTTETKKQFAAQLSFFNRLQSQLQSFIDDLSLIADVWKERTEVFWGILLTSFIINVLSVVFPIVLLQVYDRVIPNLAVNTLILLLLGVAIALIFEVILKILRYYLSGWADAKFEFLTSCKAFKHLMECRLQEFENEGAGVHLKRLNALNLLRDFYSGQAVISVVDIPFLLLFLLLIGYISGWLIVVPISILIFFIFRLIPHLKNLQKILEANQKREDLRTNYIVETLGNIHTVKSMAMEAQMIRRYERLQKIAAIFDHDLSIHNAKLVTLTRNLSQVMIVAVIAFGSLLVMSNQLTIGGLAACMLLSTRCMQPISTVVTVWSRLKLVTIARNDINTLLKMPIESKPNLPNIDSITGKIVFDNVSFRYNKNEPWIIKNLNLTIEQKEIISITGEGLAGKSTLLWLIMGILSPTAGNIFIDDKDISHYQLESLRKKIAYLPQKPILFNGTIMENLTMFQEDKYEEQAKQAAAFVGLSDTIVKLPDGYNTVVANHAIEALSRGINQRIAIARAFITEPPIVLFDEANTAIDIQGDGIIRKVLNRLVRKCTLIIVSHRPSILNLATKHYLLENSQLKIIT